jgi:acyl carrier protein
MVVGCSTFSASFGAASGMPPGWPHECIQMVRNTWILTGVVLALFSGCSDDSAPTTQPSDSSAAQDDGTVSQVCSITAELLGVNPSKVTPSTSLGDLGADELDIVELVMELEEHFDIAIPDDAITDVTGRGQWQDGAHKLTMTKLAQIVDDQKR